MKLLKQLWLPNLFRYTITRARYSATGRRRTIPTPIPTSRRRIRPLRAGILFAVGAPAVIVPLTLMRQLAGAWRSCCRAMWARRGDHPRAAAREAYCTRGLHRVIPHALTAIGRVTYLASCSTASCRPCSSPAGGRPGATSRCCGCVPVFTTFPLFMILRQWVQHGNADRGRYTNTRVFLAGPLVRYAVFPWGMDYHLPHHMIASVPHYNLKQLHEVLLRDPEYREKGVIVEGYFGERRERAGQSDGARRAGCQVRAQAPRGRVRRQRGDRACRRGRCGRAAREVEASLQME